MKSAALQEVLKKCVDLDVLYQSHPELFDFTDLSLTEKMQLLMHDAKTFYDKVIGKGFSPSDKVSILLKVKNKFIQSRIIIDEDDIDKMSLNAYARLLESDYSRYIRIEKFKKINNYDRVEWFLKEPQWFIDNLPNDVQSFTMERLTRISYNKASFIDSYITDFSHYSTSDIFWINMIKYDSKYLDIFLENTKTLITKTDVRQVCRQFPQILKNITPENIEDSKLTKKEWVLLSREIIKKNPKVLKGWEFSDEMKESFKHDLMVEMLNGKSKVTKPFTRAMDAVINDKEIEKEEDDILS